jgi:hypothetical protein
MKNLFLSTIFLVIAFASNAQSLMLKAFAVKTLISDTSKSVFDPIIYEAEVTKVNIRYNIDFNTNTVQKYEDGELLFTTTFETISELTESKQFFIRFNDEDNRNINLTQQLNSVWEFTIDNTNTVTLFDSFTIY